MAHKVGHSWVFCVRPTLPAATSAHQRSRRNGGHLLGVGVTFPKIGRSSTPPQRGHLDKNRIMGAPRRSLRCYGSSERKWGWSRSSNPKTNARPRTCRAAFIRMGVIGRLQPRQLIQHPAGHDLAGESTGCSRSRRLKLLDNDIARMKCLIDECHNTDGNEDHQGRCGYLYCGPDPRAETPNRALSDLAAQVPQS